MNIIKALTAINVMQDIVNNETAYKSIDMSSVDRPVCGTPGCHAGLWDMTLIEMNVTTRRFYDYISVARLALNWLEIPFVKRCGPESDLEYWPYKQLNGESYSLFMWSSSESFGQKSDCFPSQVIVDTWKQAIANYIAMTDLTDNQPKVEINNLEQELS